MEMNARTLELVAERFRVLGDPLRLRLLGTLGNGELTVAELVAATGASQANVSKHLGVLARSGLVRRRKAGLFVHYSAADPAVFVLCDTVCGSLRTWLAAGLAELPAPAKPARARRPRSPLARGGASPIVRKRSAR